MVKYIDKTKKVIEIDEKSLLFYKYMIDYWAELDNHPKYTLDLKIIK